MENVLTWSLLFKALAAWVGVYFLQPILFILRDYAVDWYAQKFILTEALYRAIQMRANDVWEINNKGKRTHVRTTPSETTYYIGDDEVTQEQWSRYTRRMEFHYKREARSAQLIGRRQFQLERLFRHYKQESKNPIPQLEKAAYERIAASRAALEPKKPKW